MLVFANVVEQGSLTAAADELGISRSMVSQHLKKLELRCDTQLIQRTTRKMRLTEDGQSFYYYCAELLQLAKQAEHATQPNNKQLHKPLQRDIPISKWRWYKVFVPLTRSSRSIYGHCTL